MMKKPELLSPAGDMEKLRSALLYGADAVYLAGESFGMRSACANFSDDELPKAVKLAHSCGAKVYVALNIMPRDCEYAELRRFITLLDSIDCDAVIVSDIGVMACVRECAPELEIHLSTQASAVSAAACLQWHRLGAVRIVTARELSLEAVRNIRRELPDEVELEAFIHGSMCIAYSGRCLMSQYFIGRDANRGECAQPCRWSMKTCDASVEIYEEKRPREPFVINQSGGDSFVMSSRDLCMIEHIPELCMAGISSFKIEGRVKSAYYTAVVTNAYRMAIDEYFRSPEDYRFNPDWLRELESVSHREYSTGFFFTPPHETENTTKSPGYIREKAYLAVAAKDATAGEDARFLQRNKFSTGERAELITPGKTGRPFIIGEIRDEDGSVIKSAPHPMMPVTLKLDFDVKSGDIIRAGGE